MRVEFSRKTKRERFEHCKGHCEGCGFKLRMGRFEYDHAKRCELGGDNSFDNCRVLCDLCHNAKTARDLAEIAKSRRIRDRRIGALTSRTPLPCGRNSRWKKKVNGEVVER
jgi:5-methylcytosine-specific restriction protein A